MDTLRYIRKLLKHWGRPRTVGSVVRSITYKDGSATISGLTPNTYVEGFETTLPTGVTKTHYTFDGWYENSDFSGSAITKIPATATGNKTVYAKFTGETLTVTKTATGCVITGADTANYGTAYGASISPESGFLLPTNVEVYVGDTQLEMDTDYTYRTAYRPGTSITIGIVEIPAEKVTGNLTIQAVGVDLLEPETDEDL